MRENYSDGKGEEGDATPNVTFFTQRRKNRKNKNPLFFLRCFNPPTRELTDELIFDGLATFTEENVKKFLKFFCQNIFFYLKT